MVELPRTEPIDVIKKGQMIGVPHLGGTTVIEVRNIEQTATGVTITSETGGKWPLTHDDKIRIVFDRPRPDPQARSVSQAGAKIKVRPYYHMRNGSGCRSVLSDHYVTGVVILVWEEVGVVRFDTYRAPECPCGMPPKTEAAIPYREMIPA